MDENLKVLDVVRTFFAFYVAILILEVRSLLFAVFLIAVGALCYGMFERRQVSFYPGLKYLWMVLGDVAFALFWAGLGLGYGDAWIGPNVWVTSGFILVLTLLFIWIGRVLRTKDWNRIAPLIETSVNPKNYGRLGVFDWVRGTGMTTFLYFGFLANDGGVITLLSWVVFGFLNCWVSEKRSNPKPPTRYFLHALVDWFICVLCLSLAAGEEDPSLATFVAIGVVSSPLMWAMRQSVWDWSPPVGWQRPGKPKGRRRKPKGRRRKPRGR
ncbi:MAG: hypothetical protein ACPGVO_04445 [Spirulinaceae cyanobacterium]